MMLQKNLNENESEISSKEEFLNNPNDYQVMGMKAVDNYSKLEKEFIAKWENEHSKNSTEITEAIWGWAVFIIIVSIVYLLIANANKWEIGTLPGKIYIIYFGGIIIISILLSILLPKLEKKEKTESKIFF